MNALLSLLSTYYEVTTDWTGSKYLGLTLSWDYLPRTVDIRLLIENALNLSSEHILVINFHKDYRRYDFTKRNFFTLNTHQLQKYREDVSVLRLIEAKSDEFTGWSGVSVLFASPGVEGLREFTKGNCFRLYMPIWT